MPQRYLATVMWLSVSVLPAVESTRTFLWARQGPLQSLQASARVPPPPNNDGISVATVVAVGAGASAVSSAQKSIVPSVVQAKARSYLLRQLL